MRQLKKYLLSNQRTATYVKQYLKNTNTLSKFLCKYINFGNRNFFTYLPKNIDEIKIYNFDQGGISSNNYLEAAKWLVSKMSKNKTLSCIIDDIIRYPEDKNINSFGAKNLFFKKEVYHLIPNKETSTQNILTCIQKTDAIWHQLILLTAIDVNQFTGKELNKENLKEICKKTMIFITGAYDSEGYIFWEKLPSPDRRHKDFQS